MDPEYKRLHEDFVSNSSGTTPEEIVQISFSIALSVLLLNFTRRILCWEESSLKWSVVEFICLALPLILCLTTFADRLLCILLTLLCFCIVAWAKYHISSGGQVNVNKSSERRVRLDFITNYRSGMLLVTAVCILAVDFKVFPRRLAKTETFGFGLMDLGVGAFIFGNGTIAPEARKKKINVSSKLELLKRAVIGSLPLLVLGFARLISVKASGYHEHVTEYGLHWNFFFTLALTKVFSSLLLAYILPVRYCWAASIIISVLNEGVLMAGVAEWVFQSDEGDRSDQDLLTANREGVVSSAGYLALYLAGISWGQHLFETVTDLKSKIKQFSVVCLWSGIMFTSLAYSQSLQFQPPSRRLVNWTFCNWMIAYNLFVLALFMALEIIVNYSEVVALLPWKSRSAESRKRKGHHKSKSTNDTSYSPYIFEALSYNGLAYFLLANLLTGLVNFSMNTMYVSDWAAVTIISLYMLVLHVTVFLLYRKKICLKVW